MQHQVDVAGHVHEVGDVAADQPEAGVLHQVDDVLRRPGEEVVEADDLDAPVEQVLAEVGTEETGPPGHHRPPDRPCRANHACSLRTRTRDRARRGGSYPEITNAHFDV